MKKVVLVLAVAFLTLSIHSCEAESTEDQYPEVYGPDGDEHEEPTRGSFN